MFQSFDVMTRPQDGPPRVAALREAMAKIGVDAFLVPRSDAHRGENVAPSDERLAWLTGFTGSAGHAVVAGDRAAIFVDGRYTLQVRSQVDVATFETMNIPKDKLADWLKDVLGDSGVVGFDPWLHTTGAIEKLEKVLRETTITVQPVANVVDQVWTERPKAPANRLDIHALALAGEDHGAKRARTVSYTHLTLPTKRIV